MDAKIIVLDEKAIDRVRAIARDQFIQSPIHPSKPFDPIRNFAEALESFIKQSGGEPGFVVKP